MISARTINCVALGFLFTVVVTVFWQIETDLKEQGIASGDPYDNAASYPGTIAIIVGVLLVLQLAIELFGKRTSSPERSLQLFDLRRAAMMLGFFAVCLMIVTIMGYHLATIPLIGSITGICGMRHWLKMAVSSLAIATGFAFLFEVFLNVVLLLGAWGIFIPW